MQKEKLIVNSFDKDNVVDGRNGSNKEKERSQPQVQSQREEQKVDAQNHLKHNASNLHS